VIKTLRNRPASTPTRFIALVALAAGCAVRADTPPPAATSPANPVAENKGGMFSSFKQAFTQDVDREDVRGHFDIGSPPNVQRLYCLVDPKTGRREENGVSGEPLKRRNGTTGLKSAAVSPLSCADAEQKGLLVTDGYVLTGKAAVAPPPPAASAGTAAVAAAPVPVAVPLPAPPAAAPTPVAAAPVAPVAAAGAVDASTQWEVMAVYSRFVAGQNSRDRSAVSETLLDSPDFVWVQPGGNAIWGYREALDGFEREWKGSWKLDPQLKELRIGNPAPGFAVLVTPLLFTYGAPGATPVTVTLRWSGVFVKTTAGWRIASLILTPMRG
jgi:ketosteroid isomerase-like protein